MSVIVITKGAHSRNVHLPPLTDGPRQFAHQWDHDEVEDTAHQANNFVLYATALGHFTGPVVLLSGPLPEDLADLAAVRVQLSDWSDIVGSAMGMKVEIR